MDIHVKSPSKPTTNCHRKFLNRLYDIEELRDRFGKIDQSEIRFFHTNQSLDRLNNMNQSDSRLCHVNQSEDILNRSQSDLPSTRNDIRDHTEKQNGDKISSMNSFSYICLSYLAHAFINTSHVFDRVISDFCHVIFKALSTDWLNFTTTMSLLFGTGLIFPRQCLVICLNSVAQFITNKSKWTTVQCMDIRDNPNHINSHLSENTIVHSCTKSKSSTNDTVSNGKSFQTNHRDYHHGNMRAQIWIHFVLLFCNLGIVTGQKQVSLAGYGASFPAAVYDEWINSYMSMRSTYINLDMTYDDTGSSVGIGYILGM